MAPSQLVEDNASTILLVEAGRGETFVANGLAPVLERSHAVKGVAVPSIPPLQIAWVARSFSLLPKVAHEFIDLCGQGGFCARPGN